MEINWIASLPNVSARLDYSSQMLHNAWWCCQRFLLGPEEDFLRFCPEHGGQRGAANSSAELHGGVFRLFCTQMLPCPCLAVHSCLFPKLLHRHWKEKGVCQSIRGTSGLVPSPNCSLETLFLLLGYMQSRGRTPCELILFEVLRGSELPPVWASLPRCFCNSL